ALAPGRPRPGPPSPRAALAPGRPRPGPPSPRAAPRRASKIAQHPGCSGIPARRGHYIQDRA
ncbi:hypothetical protein ACLQ3G_25060, partial [Micromonospora arida]